MQLGLSIGNGFPRHPILKSGSFEKEIRALQISNRQAANFCGHASVIIHGKTDGGIYRSVKLHVGFGRHIPANLQPIGPSWNESIP